MIALKRLKYLNRLRQVMNEVILYTVLKSRDDMFSDHFVFKIFILNTA